MYGRALRPLKKGYARERGTIYIENGSTQLLHFIAIDDEYSIYTQHRGREAVSRGLLTPILAMM